VPIWLLSPVALTLSHSVVSMNWYRVTQPKGVYVVTCTVEEAVPSEVVVMVLHVGWMPPVANSGEK